MQPLIYVAGPYRAATRAAIAQNIAAARQVGLAAALLGWFPVIPHSNTSHLDHYAPELPDEFWLRGTMEMMERCDAVVLVSGWEQSHGTQAEIARADELRIPVYRTLQALPTAASFIAWLHQLEARLA